MVGSRSGSRRGYIALMFLIVLPLLLLILLMVVMLAHLEQARGEAQTSAESAARAAALRLVDDASLQADPRAMIPVLRAALAEATVLATQNTITGTPTELIIQPSNDPESDFLFGIADSPAAMPRLADFQVPGDFPLINTVQVALVRSDERMNPLRLIGGSFLGGRFRQMTRKAAAYLDHAVIGFQPVLHKPIPFVPIALLSDSTVDDSWERQVEGAGPSTDAYRYIQTPYTVLNDRGDGLPEMTVYLLNKERNISDPPPANSAILSIGTTNMVEVSQQISRGILESELTTWGGQLVLNSSGQLSVPGTGVGPSPGTTDIRYLARAFQELMLTGAVRIWPLYTPPATQTGPILLSGFVAARVMNVAFDGPAGGLRLVIQPTSMHYVGSILAPDLATSRPNNRYLSKVRLVMPR